MIHFGRFISIIFFCGILFLVSGCGSKQKSSPSAVVTQDYTVTCIGVLPAVSMSDPRDVKDSVKEKNLRRGVEVMNRLLSSELNNMINIRFVDSSHISGLDVTGSESTVEMMRLVGQSITCNAILETRVWRYIERVGGKFTAESPASVAFDMRLIGVDTGAVLWSAKFDEVQRSAMENLYNWSKARSRGFTWVAAEDLMEEGIGEKITDNPYFKELPRKNDPDQQYPPADKV